MTIRPSTIGKSIGFTLLVLLGCITAFYALNAYIYDEKQGDGNAYEPYRATLSGELVCLPHANQDGPQTMECAFGLKTDAGEYYAVDFTLLSQEQEQLEVGGRFSASGLVTPIERLSSDHWKTYPIEGIFSVTDTVEVL